MSKTSLEQQIMAALADDLATAPDLTELIATTETAITAAQATAKLEAERTLDPAVSSDARAAQRASEDAAICAGRLKTLLPRLEDKARSVVSADEQAKWRCQYETLKSERDKLAAELRQVYPTVVSQLVDVLAKSTELDGRLSQLHQGRPSGCKGTLLATELVARGLTEYSRDQPPLARELRIPDFIESNKLAFPPSDDTPIAVRVAAPVAQVHDRRRHSADWAEAMTAEHEQRKVLERQRIEQEAALQDESKREFERTLR
jgi:hypothetical protein